MSTGGQRLDIKNQSFTYNCKSIGIHDDHPKTASYCSVKVIIDFMPGK